MNSGVETLLTSTDVYTKKLAHNTMSVNFKREVFFKNTWNDLNIKARGLFVRENSFEIVARSYEKFSYMPPNIDELVKPETEIRTFLKENGFLGILCYDKQIKAFRYFSKSTEESEYALMFRRILEPYVLAKPEAFREVLDGYTMVFEVIDPVNDPHIIEYSCEKVVLLDIIKNSYEFSKLKFKEMAKIAKSLNLPNKVEWVLCSSSVKGKVEIAEKINLIEGFVFELETDNKVFMFKVKTDYYNFWKAVRTARDRLLKDKPLKGDLVKELFDKMNLSKEEINCSVIELRRKLNV